MDTTATDKISFSQWKGTSSAEKILTIRFHATGDIALTLPACNSLRKLMPYSRIDYLTDDTAKEMLNSFSLFDSVYTLPGLFKRESSGKPKPTNKIKRIYRAFKLSKKLRKLKYDMVIDLQNNRLSRLIRKIISPNSWSEFDRYEPKPAGTRVIETFHRAGFKDLEASYDLPVKLEVLQRAEKLLLENGWDKRKQLIVLNPAGLWKTRNWTIENHVELARLFLKEEPAQILLLGTQRMEEKASHISSELGENVINLVKKTKIDEVFGILNYVSLMVSEDSGLMHSGWVSGVPTVALLGSSRSDWTMPLGTHSRCLNSSDLPCGNCMKPECIYGDVHCLTRYSAETVYNLCIELLPSLKTGRTV
jgi:heptosyltransferase-2